MSLLVYMIFSVLAVLMGSNIGVARPPQLEIKILIPSGFPIHIDSCTLERDGDGRLLKYRITNQSDEQINRGNGGLSFYQDGTRANKSYGLGYDWELLPRSSKGNTLKISEDLAETDVLLIEVWEAESENSLWKVDSLKFEETVRNYLKGKPYILPKAERWEAIKKKAQSNQRLDRSASPTILMHSVLIAPGQSGR